MGERALLSDSNARLVAARRLTSRTRRRETGLFLAEGAPSVREALRCPGAVAELFVTAEAAARHPDLLVEAVGAADRPGAAAAPWHAVAGGPVEMAGGPPGGRSRGAPIRVDEISPRAAKALSETAAPQGLIAVCRQLDAPVAEALGAAPRLVAALVEANDPGNAGTILRTADAAGAEAVLFAGDGVDPYHGKLVRASAGSLFHLPIARCAPDELLAAARAAGLSVLATTGRGARDLDDLADAGALARPTLWLFGNEARGLPSEVIEAADEAVRIPIHGAAESLNLAVAAGVCLYASARAQRR
ncbi:MAG: RNA methyltransferase [Actinomycetia bacterium]|nr:RNA methyltransferase [Actinomycetes bacterium]